MSGTAVGYLYLVSAILFILALKGLSHPETSRRGNMFGIVGMAIAIVTTIAHPDVTSYGWIAVAVLIGGGVGTVVAKKIEMTALPELVAAFHSLVGMAAVFVALAALYHPEAYGIGSAGSLPAASLIEMGLGMAIGAITFSGSVIAFAKLRGIMSGNPITFPGQHLLNLVIGLSMLGLLIYFCQSESYAAFWLLLILSFAIGFLIIIPIGGADMPVVVSMLNSYSGWAAAGIGFTLANPALIITGALVGSSGAILSYIMCKGMNRSILNVLLGGFGGDSGGGPGATDDPNKQAKSGAAPDAAFIMGNASKVIIVPGVRHGGRPGTARGPRNGRQAERGGDRGQIRHPPRGGPYAGAYERAVGRGQCPL